VNKFGTAKNNTKTIENKISDPVPLEFINRRNNSGMGFSQNKDHANNYE
jgi:hypothetical protein